MGGLVIAPTDPDAPSIMSILVKADSRIAGSDISPLPVHEPASPIFRMNRHSNRYRSPAMPASSTGQMALL